MAKGPRDFVPTRFHGLDRRTFLKTLGAAVSVAACTPTDEPEPDDTDGPVGDPRAESFGEDWAGVGSVDETLFPIHVQSGEPLPDAVMVWTNYQGTADLELVVARWEDGAWVEEAPVAVSYDQPYVHHDLTGRSPDEVLAFQFLDGDGKASRVGTTRTGLDPDHTGAVRIGATSCTTIARLDFPSLNNLAARRNMDVFCWLGDIVYADGADELDEYQDFYRRNQQTDGFQSILSATPGLYTWDDHEVGNNWDPETIDPDQMAAATQAWFDCLPTRRITEAPDRLWRSLRYGNTVEFFVLDCRSERVPSEGRYLSREQMDWLKAGLSSSDAVWKVILNSVPITDMPDVYDFIIEDRWEGYPEDRAELLDHIADEGLEGVFFLAGDLHQSSLSRVEAEGPLANVFELQCGPSGSSFLGVPARSFEDGEQWVWSDADFCATFVECRSDGTASILVVDELDQVMFDGEIDTLGNVLRAEIYHPWEHLEEG